MTRIIAHQDVFPFRTEKKFPDGHSYFRTDFVDQKDRAAPTCYLAESTPGRTTPTHFHTTDQFQVVYKGEGTLGRHDLTFGAIHFARAYTPYGPLDYGADLGFFAIRARRDEGNKIMPAARQELQAMTNRRPWQISTMPDFALRPGEGGVAMKAVEGLRDERGLAAFSMVMKPAVAAYSIDPSRGDGQCILVMKGGILHEGRQKRNPTMIWVDSSEPPFRLLAGPEGATLLILNFPVPGGGAPQQDKPPAADGRGAFKTYQCILCAFAYDEAAGHPDAGIAPGTRWADVPDSFKCPDCDAIKADFEMIAF